MLDDANADVLGDAYDYLIGQFASGAGKKAGEFYTPQQVSTILARIVTTGKTRLKSVYDPAVRVGFLLLRVAKEADVSEFFGQEMNRHDLQPCPHEHDPARVHYRSFDLKQEDTLEHPQHESMRFEAVVANPPFSANWSSNPLLLSDDRFSQYGKLAHSIEGGLCLRPAYAPSSGRQWYHGRESCPWCLFRGGAEGHIRQYLIKDRNWLDAVIGLPPNIFYGTGISHLYHGVQEVPRETEDVLFVDAQPVSRRRPTRTFFAQLMLTGSSIPSEIALNLSGSAIEHLCERSLKTTSI